MVKKEIKHFLGEISAFPRCLYQKYTYGSSAPSPYKLIYIDPNNVDHLITEPFKTRISDYGTHIQDGDWDVNYAPGEKIFLQDFEQKPSNPKLIRFENYDFYISFKNHFMDGVPWEETILWDRLVRTSTNSNRSRYKTKSEIRTRLNKIDDLYQYIKQKGYLTQSEILEYNNTPLYANTMNPNKNEVLVNIGRNGDLILDDGRHRFIIAKILNIEKIPVRVLMRHKKWQEKRNKIANSFFKDDPNSGFGDNITHPDLIEFKNHNI